MTDIPGVDPAPAPAAANNDKDADVPMPALDKSTADDAATAAAAAPHAPAASPPNPPALPGTLSTSAHLANLLAGALTDLEAVREELAAQRKRADRAERLLTTFAAVAATLTPPTQDAPGDRPTTASTADPSASPEMTTTSTSPPAPRDSPSVPMTPLPAAVATTPTQTLPPATVAHLLALDERTAAAEQRRDDALARLALLQSNWAQLNAYLGVVDARAQDARQGFTRIVEGGGGRLVLVDVPLPASGPGATPPINYPYGGGGAYMERMGGMSGTRLEGAATRRRRCAAIAAMSSTTTPTPSTRTTLPASPRLGTPTRLPALALVRPCYSPRRGSAARRNANPRTPPIRPIRMPARIRSPSTGTGTGTGTGTARGTDPRARRRTTTSTGCCSRARTRRRGRTLRTLRILPPARMRTPTTRGRRGIAVGVGSGNGNGNGKGKGARRSTCRGSIRRSARGRSMRGGAGRGRIRGTASRACLRRRRRRSRRRRGRRICMRAGAGLGMVRGRRRWGPLRRWWRIRGRPSPRRTRRTSASAGSAGCRGGTRTASAWRSGARGRWGRGRCAIGAGRR
ncbi:hypothetical protein K438DRAFT_1143778 [Mycena galopus ATCC 62051]|nr:hypothetical protein K438DRAFT_1143778 [Mycena galopus ATCC 62051]